MSYNFKNLADIELLTEVPETANKIIEVDGTIKRVPNKEVSGGNSMIKTAWIKQTVDYGGAPDMYSSIVPSDSSSFECVNMTFEEALGYLQNNEPLACFITSYHYEGSTLYKVNTYGTVILDGDTIGIHYIDPIDIDPTYIRWTSEGISTSNDEPSTPPA